MPLERVVIPPPTRGLDMEANYGFPQSTAIRAGNYVFLSGITAIQPGTGERMLGTVTSEAHQCFQNLSMILGRAGSSLERVVQVHAMIYDRVEYDVLNRVYRQYMADAPPARTVWSVKLPYGFKVQLDVVAVI
jgi:2-iminobutanoate/2-iminopropanoate deaminase